MAREAGMTDAGVAHHFGSRDALLKALLQHGAARLRAEVRHYVDQWQSKTPDLGGLVDLLSALYNAGYGHLALQLHAAGWRDRGSPLLEPVVDSLMATYPDAHEDALRVALAAMHQAIALDPLFGSEFRRSVGLKKGEGEQYHRQWWVRALERTLDPSGSGSSNILSRGRGTGGKRR